MFSTGLAEGSQLSRASAFVISSNTGRFEGRCATGTPLRRS